MKNKANIRYVIFILLFTFLTYLPSLKNGFVNWDDDYVLLKNSAVYSLDSENLKKIFTTPVVKVYAPLTLLSFAVEHHFFKFDPFIYHLDNLLLHLGVVFLLFLFGMQCGLSERAAALAALMFGVHPMHVESVAWVTERKDVLYSFFYMLALYTYMKYIDRQELKLYVLTCLFGFLSILAKPMALSLPFILLFCDMWKNRTFTARLLIEKLVLLIYIIPITWVTYALHARVSETPIGEKILLWMWTFGFYVQRFFLSTEPIVPYYPMPEPVSLLNMSFLLAVVFFVFCLACLTRFKKLRWFNFSTIFYFLSIFFLLRYDKGIDASFVADRFMYLPSAGFCFLIGYGLDWMLKKFEHARIGFRMFVRTLLVLIFLFTATMSYAQCFLWKNSIVFWTYVISRRPAMANAYANRGVAHLYRKQYRLALADHSKALELEPKAVGIYSNRGAIYAKLNRYDLAIADFNKAIELAPEYIFARRNKARALQNCEKFKGYSCESYDESK